jgi:hypothetical protein
MGAAVAIPLAPPESLLVRPNSEAPPSDSSPRDGREESATCTIAGTQLDIPFRLPSFSAAGRLQAALLDVDTAESWPASVVKLRRARVGVPGQTGCRLDVTAVLLMESNAGRANEWLQIELGSQTWWHWRLTTASAEERSSGLPESLVAPPGKD